MAKSKALTPQEIYRQRKQREERERAAFLPPGLINHGNTCFMNSVLQGLLATRLLADLVYFNPIPTETQKTAAAPILSTRSPQLLNGHYFAGKYKQPYVLGMPIGDVFLDTIDKAWVAQANRRKEVLSPRILLTTLGRKYDQYLDFAQQDAHEFLRILLDAMRMEEFDIIKVRQPPPPPKKRRRTTITPADVREGSPTPARQTGDAGSDPRALPPLQTNGEAEKLPLMSFVDMIFGGQLTSILVCQKCKHVSQTYEDFNDISLSLKLEDYANRKRDRFRRIVGRLTGFPSGNNVPVKEKLSVTVPTDVASAPIHSVEMQRSSSVPPTPSKEKQGSLPGGLEETQTELRRRSLELTVGSSTQRNRSEGGEDDLTPAVIEVIELGSESGTEGKDRTDEDGGMGSDSSHVIVNVTGLEDRHVELIEPKKERDGSSSDQEAKITKEKKSEEAAWAKIGRRISLNLGLGRQKGKDKDKKEGVDRASLGVGIIKESDETPPMQKSHSVPSTSTSTNVNLLKSRVSSDQSRLMEPIRPPSHSTQSSITFSSNQDNPPQAVSQGHASLPTPKFPTIQRSKSPKPPKPTVAETEYLRRILADVAFPPNNPFNIFRPPLLHHESLPSGGAGEREKERTGSMWLGLGSRNFSGIEECLRMFTAVEVLDGENMVGCRRCWKIQNGVLQPKKDSDQDDEDDGDDEPLPVPSPDVAYDKKPPALTLQPPLNLGSPTPSSPIHIQASQSTPTVSFYTQESRSVSSLPTSLSDANLTLLKNKSGEEHPDSPSSISIVSEGSSMTAEIEGVQQQTPGGLPIPIISTTAPIDVVVTSSSGSRDSDSESHYSSASEGKISCRSINRRTSYPTGFGHIYEKHSKDSLAIPARQMNGHHRQVSPETSADEGSSEDESDSSIGTSVSAESSVSRLADMSPSVQASTAMEPFPSRVQSSQQFPLQRPFPEPDKPPRKPLKPKPVVMRPAYKRYLIATPPPVLVIHLKRFQQTSKAPLMLSFSNGFKKLDEYVSFPEYLDLSPFLAPRKEDYGLGKKSKKEKGKEKGVHKTKANPREERCMYRLYAVVVHIGNMLGGHYIAYTALPDEPRLHHSEKPSCTPRPSDGQICNEEQKTSAEIVPPERQWAYVSDTHVRLTTLEEVLNSKAYICMYERC